MPLSEHEQRLLEQMERALYAEDPKLASTLRGADLRAHHRRRVALGRSASSSASRSCSRGATSIARRSASSASCSCSPPPGGSPAAGVARPGPTPVRRAAPARLLPHPRQGQGSFGRRDGPLRGPLASSPRRRKPRLDQSGEGAAGVHKIDPSHPPPLSRLVSVRPVSPRTLAPSTVDPVVAGLARGPPAPSRPHRTLEQPGSPAHLGRQAPAKPLSTSLASVPCRRGACGTGSTTRRRPPGPGRRPLRRRRG